MNAPIPAKALRSRSVVTKYIQFLEDWSGTRLLARTTRSVAPTEAGERLHDRLVPAFRDIADALDDLNALRGAPYVKDIRNLGMVAGVELESRPGAPGARAYEAFLKCLELGVLVRYTGDLKIEPALAESWEMVSCKTDAIIAEGDRVVWIGRVRWRNASVRSNFANDLDENRLIVSYSIPLL